MGTLNLGEILSYGKLPGYTQKGSFWWRDILKLLNIFKGVAKVR